jgi:hypothetical protein
MKAERRYAFATLLSSVDTYELTDELCCAESAGEDTPQEFIEAIHEICQRALDQRREDDSADERDVAAEIEFVDWLDAVANAKRYLDLCNEMGDMGFARRLNDEHYSIVDKDQWRRYRDKADAERKKKCKSKAR